jgi:hypothetical protein
LQEPLEVLKWLERRFYDGDLKLNMLNHDRGNTPSAMIQWAKANDMSMMIYTTGLNKFLMDKTSGSKDITIKVLSHRGHAYWVVPANINMYNIKEEEIYKIPEFPTKSYI